MAKKRLMGIEIGNYRMKMAVCENGVLEEFLYADVPDNMVRDDEIVSWEAMADFIGETMAENNISCKEVALALPDKLAYITRIRMPLMTINQLKVNLPYEFHDYITEDMDKYFYDYSVISIDEDPESGKKEMDLVGVAASKEIVDKYRTMFRRAGLRLVLVAPAVLAFRNIIKDHEQVRGITEKQDYAILDLGHKSIKLHFFTGGEYEITRTMEPGCEVFTETASEAQSVEKHIAQINFETDRDEIQSSEVMTDNYSHMAVEIMRVMNFYGFNHPENNLTRIHYCGGGENIGPLLAAIQDTMEYQMTGISELITDKTEAMDLLVQGPQALGIVWE